MRRGRVVDPCAARNIAGRRDSRRLCVRSGRAGFFHSAVDWSVESPLEGVLEVTKLEAKASATQSEGHLRGLSQPAKAGFAPGC